jgi:hypothetical protein
LKKIVSGSTAEWLKELSEGICYEEVKDRMIPTTSGAVKTFKRVHTFEDVIINACKLLFVLVGEIYSISSIGLKSKDF